MQLPPDKYVVRKGKEWLMSSRPDILELPHKHVFSVYVNDAKRYDTRREARRMARRIGGTVYTFNQATGRYAECVVVIPKGAKCDNCRKWTPYDGICRNPDSEMYREYVSMDDVCEEWEDKADGREGQVDSAAISGNCAAERPGN